MAEGFTTEGARAYTAVSKDSQQDGEIEDNRFKI